MSVKIERGSVNLGERSSRADAAVAVNRDHVQSLQYGPSIVNTRGVNRRAIVSGARFSRARPCVPRILSPRRGQKTTRGAINRKYLAADVMEREKKHGGFALGRLSLLNYGKSSQNLPPITL